VGVQNPSGIASVKTLSSAYTSSDAGVFQPLVRRGIIWPTILTATKHNVDRPGLLADLKTKTTFPPIVITTDINATTTLLLKRSGTLTL